MELTFEQLPAAIASLYAKLEGIEHLIIEQQKSKQPEGDQLLNVEDTAKFLSLSVPTIYGLISRGQLPVMKRSKRCYFSKMELLNYLRQGRKKTLSETSLEAQKYINGKAK